MMKATILVVYFFVFMNTVLALVPVEGILMGEANTEYQQDPLNFIFKPYYDTSVSAQNAKLKLYHSFFSAGESLKYSCSQFGEGKYPSPWHEKQARRAVVSTLQYLGLDASIKALGPYAKKMEIDQEGFKNLTKNLIQNYCSKNITIFSIKTMEKALEYYYNNASMEMIPSLESSPFITSLYVTTTEKKRARSQEFDQLIKNFRAFCSWGGDVTEYRMMTPYLKNPFIMSFVFKNLMGTGEIYDPELTQVKAVPDSNTVQVNCSELICRKVPSIEFKEKFPKTVGSTGIYSDLAKLYCGHFRYQEYSNSTTAPEVRAWIKNAEIESPILETNFFISLLTGVPDAGFGIANYVEYVNLAKSSIDERWSSFSRAMLGNFSRDMLYEESLRIRPIQNRDKYLLRANGFKVDFSITLGEMDRVMNNSDKIDMSFEVKVTKNYLRWIRMRWGQLASELDTHGLEKLKADVSKYVEVQVKEKEKFFRQKIWNDQFSVMIAEEIIAQTNIYTGPLFEDYEEKVITVPVRFSYGLFALSYLKYRADVSAGRLKLNL